MEEKGKRDRIREKRNERRWEKEENENVKKGKKRERDRIAWGSGGERFGMGERKIRGRKMANNRSLLCIYVL